jgi:drug/metabolite transporter (DMT)-like permease
VILAHISIKAEPITRRKALGVIVAFAGVAAIFWRDLASAQVSTMQFSLLGSLAIVGSAASGAAGNVVAKKYASGIDPSANVLIQSVVGAVSLLFVSIVTERGSVLKLVPTVIAAVLYLGVVGSALAFVGWYWLLTKTTATNSSLVLFVTPVVALILGWLVLQEVVEPVVALGTFLILSGVYLTVKQGKVAS